MTDAIPEGHLQRLLEEVADKNGVKKPRYAVSAGSKAGDNYVGMLYRVEVREGASAAEPAEPVLRLIIKGMPKSKRRREEGGVVRFFDNEFAMYRVVLPGLHRFVNGVLGGDLGQSDSFPYTAPFHRAQQGGAEGEDALVLEDMRPRGFTLHDRRVGLDEHHIRSALRSLAHLHAASMAMRDQRPEEFQELRSSVNETLFHASCPFGEEMDEMVVKRSYAYIKDRFPEGSEGYNKLKVLLDGYMAEMGRLCSPCEDGGNAILHGDCWTNNILFKYSKSGAVEENCLLDFQLSRFASPVLDIAYLVFCCTVRELREKHLDKLLGEYHDQLSANLRRLGSDPDKLYSRDTMQTQLRERARFGLGMALITVPLFLAETEEVPDMDEQFEKGVDMKDMMDIEGRSAPERNKRISDALEELMERGWI